MRLLTCGVLQAFGQVAGLFRFAARQGAGGALVLVSLLIGHFQRMHRADTHCTVLFTYLLLHYSANTQK